MVEAIKHGLIADRDYYHWIVRAAGQLADRNPAAIARLVRRSVAIKARLVSRDEREAGPRAALNAGHTVGHALEQASGYRLRHGDAVGLGLVVEAVVAGHLGLGQRELAPRLVADLRSLGIPLRFPSGISDRAALVMMGRDKKNLGKVIHCALVSQIGTMARPGGAWTVESPQSVLKNALQEARLLVR